MNVRVAPFLFLLGGGTVAVAQAGPAVVRVATPVPATATESYEVPGRTEPLEAARIFTRANGIVRERRFDIGDRVEAGAVLAVIDAPELDRAVEAARATREQAEVRHANAKEVADRVPALVQARALSREEGERRTMEATAAAAALRVATAEQERLVEQQKFGTVTAPFAGVIAARNFDRGDRVRGDAATADGWLYQLVRLDELRFVIGAAPDLALRIGAEPQAIVRFREFPGQTFPATSARQSRVFDAAAGTMRLELRLANPELRLPAGLTGTALFELPPVAGTFLVPTNCVQVRAGKGTLTIVRDGKAAILEVATGRVRGTSIEVMSAQLTATAQVVVNPNSLLREGEPLQVAPAAAR